MFLAVTMNEIAWVFHVLYKLVTPCVSSRPHSVVFHTGKHTVAPDILNMVLLKLLFFTLTFYGLIVDLDAIICPKGKV